MRDVRTTRLCYVARATKKHYYDHAPLAGRFIGNGYANVRSFAGYLPIERKLIFKLIACFQFANNKAVHVTIDWPEQAALLMLGKCFLSSPVFVWSPGPRRCLALSGSDCFALLHRYGI